jgi:hypothetical protein
MEQEFQYRQIDFFHLLPGSAGGRSLRDRRGSEYFSDPAKNAAARKTKKERQAIHQKGVKERLRRLYTIPRTEIYEELGYLVTERIVPWWPHQRGRQKRKRPIFVRIELSCEQVEELSPREMLATRQHRED